MRYLLIIVTLFAISVGYSQQLNLGANIGSVDGCSIKTVGATIEFRPSKSFFTINSAPFLFMNDRNPVVTLPLSIKFFIGNKIRVCPSYGLFLRTNSNFGYNAGLSLEGDLGEKLIVFAKGDYIINCYKDTIPNKFGGRSLEVPSSRVGYMYSLGLMKRIFSK